jgi:dephospho-CoA kinase
MGRDMKILITGNVGSGKSTFLKMLKQYVNPEFYNFVDLDLIAKQIIKDRNIALPDKKTQVFENLNLLYGLENQILPFLADYLPKEDKTLIMEASTLFECPLILNNDDVVIHVISNNAAEQTYARDKVENRAALISKVQISPWIKSLIADVEIANNSTLEDLENKAKFIANNLNEQQTLDFNVQVTELNNYWNKQFNDITLIENIIKQYTTIDRKDYNQAYLLGNIVYLNHLELKLSPLWKNALYLAVYFYKYFNHDNIKNENAIQELYKLAKSQNLLGKMVYGSRSYLTLACELLYSADLIEPNAADLSDGDGKVAHEIFYKLVKQIF